MKESFDWDEGNIYKSDEKHGITTSETESVWHDENKIIMESEKSGADENRYL